MDKAAGAQWAPCTHSYGLAALLPPRVARWILELEEESEEEEREQAAREERQQRRARQREDAERVLREVAERAGSGDDDDESDREEDYESEDEGGSNSDEHVHLRRHGRQRTRPLGPEARLRALRKRASEYSAFGELLVESSSVARSQSRSTQAQRPSISGAAAAGDVDGGGGGGGVPPDDGAESRDACGFVARCRGLIGDDGAEHNDADSASFYPERCRRR